MSQVQKNSYNFPTKKILNVSFNLGLLSFVKFNFFAKVCDCGYNTETITHFFLHCPSFHTFRQTLLNNIRNINKQILPQGEDQLTQTFLYGKPNLNLTVNRLNETIEYLTKQFNIQLFRIKRNNWIFNINRTIQMPSFQLIIKKINPCLTH